MNVDEAWALIADCTRAGDWTGVLVAADALQENDMDRQAEIVRLTVEEGLQPYYDVNNRVWKLSTQSSCGRMIYTQTMGSWTGEALIWGWKWVVTMRLNHLSSDQPF